MPVQKTSQNYVAVLDIGSNAVRLVIYDGIGRTPVKVHNERNICSLGADLGVTGRLHPEGVARAFESIARFSGLLKAMKIRDVRAVATAALRDADDGADFIKSVKKKFGLSIHVIDGDEEARLSAQGVMMNGLGESGVIGDYGGGSLELIVMKKGKMVDKGSVPLGSHRLLALKTRTQREEYIADQLDRLPFLKKLKNDDFYALGGAWRSMAKAHMLMVRHPIPVIDQYSIERGAATDFAALISRQSTASLEKIAGFSKKRARDIGVAALAMEMLFAKIAPKRLIFSGTGLREGLLFDQLKKQARALDGLVDSAAGFARVTGRFDNLEGYAILSRWMTPLFPLSDMDFPRLLLAASYLSDCGWRDHEDAQADLAFRRILVMPFYGADHRARAFLALALYVRYGGDAEDALARPVHKILGEDLLRRAVMAGQAIALAYLLTGGALALLVGTRIEMQRQQLALDLGRKSSALNAEAVMSAIEKIAKTAGKKARIH